MSAAVLEGDERVNSVSVDGLVSFNRIIWGAISVGPSGERSTDQPTQLELMERDKKTKGSIASVCVACKG